MKVQYTQKITLLLLTAFAGLTISSCNNNGFKETENGLHYRIVESKGGKKPKTGDILRLSLNYVSSTGEVIYDSKILGDTFMIELTKPSFKGGLEEGFGLMGEGDSATFRVSADSIFDKMFHMKMPDKLKKGEMMLFNVRLKKIMTVGEMQSFLMSPAERQEKADEDSIRVFMTANNVHLVPLRKGVYMTTFKEGTGMQPVKGDRISVKYIAKSLSGKVFDATYNEAQSTTFVLGEGDFLPAFVDAVLSMKKGQLARLVVTSENAYGNKMIAQVPPNTPLVFDIELVDIKKKK